MIEVMCLKELGLGAKALARSHQWMHSMKFFQPIPNTDNCLLLMAVTSKKNDVCIEKQFIQVDCKLVPMVHSMTCCIRV